MKQFTETKSVLTKSLLEMFTQVEGDEIEAMVTHWLQSPTQKIPFLTSSMRDHCWSFFKRTSETKRRTQSVEEPRAPYQAKLPMDWGEVPFPPPQKPQFTFIDLFSGIGGFRLAMQEQLGKCVFSSEWDPSAKKTYEANFGEVPFGDIRKISENSIPDHDVYQVRSQIKHLKFQGQQGFHLVLQV